MLLRLFFSLDECEDVSLLIFSFLAVQKYSIFGLATSGLMELMLRKIFSQWKLSYENGYIAAYMVEEFSDNNSH